MLIKIKNLIYSMRLAYIILFLFLFLLLFPAYLIHSPVFANSPQSVVVNTPYVVKHFNLNFTFFGNGTILIQSLNNSMTLVSGFYAFANITISTVTVLDSGARKIVNVTSSLVLPSNIQINVINSFIFYNANPVVKLITYLNVFVNGLNTTLSIPIYFTYYIPNSIDNGLNYQLRKGPLFFGYGDVIKTYSVVHANGLVKVKITSSSVIDPTVSSTNGTAQAQAVISSGAAPFGSANFGSASSVFTPSHRALVYAQGLFWLFYQNGTSIYYRTSSNGITWSAPNTLVASTGDISVVYDPYTNKIYYTRTNPSGAIALYFRSGTPYSNGTLVLDGTGEINLENTYTIYYASITYDSAGNLWIAAQGQGDSNGRYTYVYKYSGGTWTRIYASTPYASSRIVPLALNNSAILIASGGSSPGAFLNTSNGGSTWTIISYPNDPTPYIYYQDAVASIGNQVYLLVNAYDGGNTNLYIAKYTYGVGWSAWVKICAIANGSESQPVPATISISNSTGWIYVASFYINLNIFVSTNGGSTWSNVETITSAGYFSNTITAINNPNVLGDAWDSFAVAWINGTSPYNLRFVTYNPVMIKQTTTAYSYYWSYSSSNTTYEYSFSYYFPISSTSKQLNITYPKGQQILNVTSVSTGTAVPSSDYSVFNYNSTYNVIVIPNTAINTYGSSYKLFTTAVDSIYSITTNAVYYNPGGVVSFSISVKDPFGNPLSQAVSVYVWNASSNTPISSVSGTSTSTGWFNSTITLPSTVASYYLRANTTGTYAGLSYITIIVDKAKISSIMFTKNGSIQYTLVSSYDGSSLTSLYQITSNYLLIYDIERGLNNLTWNVYTRQLFGQNFEIMTTNNNTITFVEISNTQGIISFNVTGPTTVMVWLGNLGKPFSVVRDGSIWNNWTLSNNTLIINVPGSNIELLFPISSTGGGGGGSANTQNIASNNQTIPAQIIPSFKNFSTTFPPEVFGLIIVVIIIAFSTVYIANRSEFKKFKERPFKTKQLGVKWKRKKKKWWD